LKQRQNILSAPSTELPEPIELAEEAEVDADVELREVEISSELHGERMDRALALLLPEFSRSFAQQLLTEQSVTRLLPQIAVVTKASTKVRLGERYSVSLRPTPQSQAFQPEAMSLNVVHEDADLRVIYKPAGLVVHPAPGNWRGTLLNGLLALDPQAVMLPRAGIVHRLDKDTSGLMVVARTRRAMDALVAMIAAREVHREYLAVGYRAWNGSAKREVEAAIGRDTRNRLRMAVVDLTRQSGKEARTTFEKLASQEDACLVQCTLHTGRTHQIRVHMAHIGHPLLGDALYAGPMQLGIERQALHAFRLSFAHPVTGHALKFEAPLPPDMTHLLTDLKLDGVTPTEGSLG
jgi:23S rRNA pseudouridine1911/1915/1917 synthase